ncbi:uncharacterized protein BX663DRAFT_492200 [Cokeromyces recurvatus]|uniref:uncharacterized protein n=1 Tax=Cokeromyces recurvatus TaxID=90255 RepID=UPI00221E6A1A|nr:uncharacterized protein BX663DRAFT_492200 [Cokeromyces recurvatus]KAI7907848.1 hypothetical protein BX663DRAFT_492200 [Cokeromyces recurvatus]
MKAEYCVDYLSYQWSPEDLIQTYKENYKQRQCYIINTITPTDTLLTKNEKRLKKSEEYKLLRFQNALWRTMARDCTNQLGQSNKLIHPSTVSWQKESDITWLYGPIYTATSNNRNIEMEKKKNVQQQQQKTSPTLKPVLKKYNSSNVTQNIPTYSDNNVMIASRTNSFSSISSKSSSVHFNPEIIEIEYQPEYPVSSIIDNDKNNNDMIWSSLLLQTSISLKSFPRFISISKQQITTMTKKRKQLLHPSSLQFVALLASTMKSVISLSTTWLLFQCLSWLTKQKNITTTAGQSSSTKNNVNTKREKGGDQRCC